MLTEFDLIDQFFSQKKHRSDVLLGTGDDCALLQPPPGQTLAMSMDTFISGVHFPTNTDPSDIAYKALAVNLSDLAAMGAEPAWVMLALTLPDANREWLTQFTHGFFELINRYHLQLIGGDTTRGNLSITVQVTGFIQESKALKRSGAKPGDHIYVTGTLGDAGLALQLLQTNKTPDPYLLNRLNRPTPRIETGLALHNLASSCIDISDGLVADLKHILKASNVGAQINIADLPFSSALEQQLSLQEAWHLGLNAGDDYELCFTVPPQQEQQLTTALKNIDCAYTCIGVIEVQKDLRLLQHDGTPFALQHTGFRHF
jgi:thiamine-monophosphate kinase